jgi:hypothetical protein
LFVVPAFPGVPPRSFPRPRPPPPRLTLAPPSIPSRRRRNQRKKRSMIDAQAKLAEVCVPSPRASRARASPPSLVPTAAPSSSRLLSPRLLVYR